LSDKKTVKLTKADILTLLMIGTKEADKYFVGPGTVKRWQEIIRRLDPGGWKAGKFRGAWE